MEYQRQLEIIGSSFASTYNPSVDVSAIQELKKAVVDASAKIPAGHEMRQHMTDLYEAHSNLFRNMNSNMPTIAANARKYILLMKQLNAKPSDPALLKKLAMIVDVLSTGAVGETKSFMDKFQQKLGLVIDEMTISYGGNDWSQLRISLEKAKHDYMQCHDAVINASQELSTAEADLSFKEHSIKATADAQAAKCNIDKARMKEMSRIDDEILRIRTQLELHKRHVEEEKRREALERQKLFERKGRDDSGVYTSAPFAPCGGGLTQTHYPQPGVSPMAPGAPLNGQYRQPDYIGESKTDLSAEQQAAYRQGYQSYNHSATADHNDSADCGAHDVEDDWEKNGFGDAADNEEYDSTTRANGNGSRNRRGKRWYSTYKYITKQDDGEKLLLDRIARLQAEQKALLDQSEVSMHQQMTAVDNGYTRYLAGQRNEAERIQLAERVSACQEQLKACQEKEAHAREELDACEMHLATALSRSKASDIDVAQTFTDLTSAATRFQQVIGIAVEELYHSMLGVSGDLSQAAHAIPCAFRLIAFNDAISNRYGIQQLLKEF